MEISIENQIKMFNTIAEDNVFDAQEKRKLELMGIDEELRNNLCNKSDEEKYDILEKNLKNKEKLEQKQELPWYKRTWNSVSKFIFGAAGGAAALKVAANLGTSLKGMPKLGFLGALGTLGVLCGIGVAALTSFKSKTVPVTSESSKEYKESDFFNTLEAEEVIVQAGDNISKIAKAKHTNKRTISKANPEITDLDKIQIGQQIHIPERREIKKGSLHNVKQTAIATGVSEEYINDIIVGFEGKNRKASLSVYYDDTSDEQNPKGHLTIGLGHTGDIDGEPLSEGTKDITEEQVYELLTQDLLNAKNAVIDYIGEDNFNKAPQSIKDALVDIAFNKGIELGFEGIDIKDGAEVKRKTLTKNLKHDIEKQDYASAAKHVIYNTDSNGLKRRNVYRVIMATKDLSEEDRKQVLDATENYYKETKSAQKPLEKSEMTKAWKQAKRGICNNFFD